MKVDVSRSFLLRPEGEEYWPAQFSISLSWYGEEFGERKYSVLTLQAKDTSLFKASSQENHLGDNLEASLFNPVN